MAMNDEEMALYDSYKKETELCYELANRLDASNPELPGAFIGNPSERILRQLRANRVPGFIPD